MTGSISRRELIGGTVKAGVLAVAGAWLPSGAAAAAQHWSLVFFDPESQQSMAFARSIFLGGHGRLVSVRSPELDLWRLVSRNEDVASSAGVAGVTRWSDRVALAGLLAERGFRLVRELPLDGTYFQWSMLQATRAKSKTERG